MVLANFLDTYCEKRCYCGTASVFKSILGRTHEQKNLQSPKINQGGKRDSASRCRGIYQQGDRQGHGAHGYCREGTAAAALRAPVAGQPRGSCGPTLTLNFIQAPRHFVFLRGCSQLRKALPAARRLSSFISEYLRDRITPWAPASSAALTAW